MTLKIPLLILTFLAGVLLAGIYVAPAAAMSESLSAPQISYMAAIDTTPVDISPLPKPTADSTRVRAIFNIIFAIIGALSLLMVTIGGFRYITSEGDPQATAKAKGTIIYALVGLIVSISAVSIVTFVLTRAT